MSIGPGFAPEAREIREAYRLGAISVAEYREGLRHAAGDAGFIRPDEEFFFIPKPLPGGTAPQEDEAGDETMDGMNGAADYAAVTMEEDADA